jgi:hypothetical protein
MRAVVFDRSAPDASATRIADVAVPQPVPGQVAIDVVAAGVNFIDVMARRGDPAYADGWPFVPGLEVAGRYGHSVPGSPAAAGNARGRVRGPRRPPGARRRPRLGQARDPRGGGLSKPVAHQAS